MSKRELNKCKKCHSRHNGNGDMCGICQDNTIELLTLGLLQEKDKGADLLFACKFAKAHIKKNAHKKALPILRAAIAKAE